MKLITFYLLNGEEVLINPEQVSVVKQYGGKTRILAGGEVITVDEPVGSVINRLQEVKP